MDSEKANFEKMYLFNEKMVHLVDDIFWNLGFKSAEHAEKVTSESFHCLKFLNDLSGSH